TAILRMPGIVADDGDIAPLDSLDETVGDAPTEALDVSELEGAATEKMEPVRRQTLEQPRLSVAGRSGDTKRGRKPLLLDVTSHALGVETLGGLFDVIIDRNARVPVRRTKMFTTTRRGQTSVRLKVFEGVERKALRNNKLGEL